MKTSRFLGNFTKVITLLLLVLLFFSFLWIIYINNQTQKNNAPVNSGAIFGGRLEDGYKFSGYVLSDLGATLKICSAVLISPTQAVTAAHCLDNNGQKFVGIGEYTSDHSKYHAVESVVIHPDWLTFNKAENDFGIIILKDPIVLDQYAEIEKPSLGCNFVVVGYGKQDDSENFTPLRKSTDVCIESTDYLENDISFTGKDGGLCFGDSGSGVFEKDTNKFITIASSIDSCYVNNFAVGAPIFGKLDSQTTNILADESNKNPCGYIDVQNNKLIDNEDLQAFMGDYLKYCSDSNLINGTIQCGGKDSNKDNVINLIDFSNFADLYARGSCN